MDGNAKSLLLHKPLLASLLKRMIERYADMATEEIIPLLDPSHEGNRIIGLSGELRPGGGDPIRLDSLFEIKDPEGNRSLVNLEFQGALGNYPLVKRGMFYLAVILSNEKNVFFSNEDYGKICPVHGIWIVFDPPSDARGTWKHYTFQNSQQGEVPIDSDINYRLMELDVINLGLGTPEAYNGNSLLEILSLLFECELPLEERRNALRKYEIELNEEEMKEMGSFATEYGIYREMKGVEKGKEQGFAEGERQGFANGQADCIRRLSRNCSPEKIAEMMELPLKEIRAYLS